ncbi:MAG: hypothetical protein IJR00_07200 [Lachnospiraceae bacterium]|nr:hypothetical protein [Lachnospiraceae bacterium]
MKEALAEAERFTTYLEADKKDALRIRLLTEEAAAPEDPSMEQFRTLGQSNPEAGMSDAAWLLSVFRKNVKERSGSVEKTATETSALEELEKSIVASIADEVKVYVRKDGAEIVIEKNLSVK